MLIPRSPGIPRSKSAAAPSGGGGKIERRGTGEIPLGGVRVELGPREDDGPVESGTRDESGDRTEIGDRDDGGGIEPDSRDEGGGADMC